MYRMEFVIKADELRLEYAEGIVYRYLDAAEQGFRAKAIELARGTRKVPRGKAILLVMSTNASIWQEKRDLLAKRHAPERSERSQVERASAVPASGDDHTQWKIAQPTNEKGYCRAFNTTKCSRKECKFAHECDVVVSKTGKACASTNHTRKTHDASRHGKPVQRP